MVSALRKIKRKITADESLKLLAKMSKKDESLSLVTERELIQLESQAGQVIFGAVPSHVLRRDFFNLDETTWVWHEEVQQPDGTISESTTRYEVQSRGILMVQPGPKYSYLEGQELHNFVLAVKAYYERVSRSIYRVDPRTGEKIRTHKHI